MLLRLCENIADISVRCTFNFRTETHALFIGTLFDYLIKTVKRAAADKENIRGVDLDKLLVGMLASALRRNIRNRSLKQL